MLISTVCKMHGLSRIRGPNSVFLPFFFSLSLSLHFLRPFIFTHGLADLVITPCRFERVARLAHREDAHRSVQIVLIFTKTFERVSISISLSRPILRSRSAGRVSRIRYLVSSDFHCVASGRAPVSLTMACVLKLVAVSRRHQAVYCIQISLSFIITI